MHRTARFVLASLFALALHSAAQAGIVLTAVQTSPHASQNVTVNLYATWDGLPTGGAIPNPGVNSANVGAYRFRANIVGTTVTGLTASHNFSPVSVWSGITPYAVIPNGSPVVVGQQIDFRAANTDPGGNVAIPNVTVGTTQDATTLLGTINFTTTPAFFQMNFTALQSDDYSGITGFGYVATNGANQQFTHVFSGPTVNLVVVPEPGTFALCGLAGIVGVWRARRKNRK